jgi:hypothetical protein
MDQDVTLAPQAVISGTVLRLADGDDQPLQGAQVTAYKVSEFPNVVSATALTDEDGEYVLSNLSAPEEYIIEFAYPEGAIAQTSVRVVLDAGEQADDVDATLVLAGGS